jgi:orotate phosphoribosyltransferase
VLHLDARRLARLSAGLASLLAQHEPDVVCGPMIGGAFVAQHVATELGAEFVYAERFEPPDSNDALFAVEYRVPTLLRDAVRGKRAAVVDDVINAGSATRATFADLVACGARPVVIGALLVLGEAAAAFAAAKGVALERDAALPSDLWDPGGCPLCAAGIPLQDP